MLNVKSRRRAVQGKSRLLFYLEMKDAIEKVLASGSVSFSRSSPGCLYWRQPAVSAGTNVSRHRKGLLVECADTNVLSKNACCSQEDVDLRWNNMVNGCLRAFFFEGNCNDEMGLENGTPTDITYETTLAYWPHGRQLRDRCANFNGSTSKVNIGSAADIDNLTELTIAFWTYCSGLGGGGLGKFYWKGDNTYFEVYQEAGGYVGIHAKVGCATISAETTAIYPLQKVAFRPVAFTYSDSGDRKVHIFVNGVDVGGTQIAGVGARLSDAGSDGYIGNTSAGTYGYNGMITTFLIYNRVLSSAELKWVAHDEYHGLGGDLRVSMWEKNGYVDPAKVSHGMVMFSFDDEFISQLTKAKPVFDAKGVVGCLAISTNYIGTGGRMTADQIKQFIASGWEIVSHSVSHANPLGLTENQLRAELADSKIILEALGTTVRCYRWPYTYSYAAQRAICSEYYEGAGGVAYRGTWNSAYNLLMDDLLYHTLATAKAAIDTAYTCNYLCAFFMHEVTDAQAAMLSDLIQYAKDKGMPILTLSQALANMKMVPPVPLYGAFSVKCQNVHATAAKLLYQIKTLMAEDYIVSFLAYTDGSAITSADMVPFGGAAGWNAITVFNYEHLGGGVYLCWGVFTATVANWEVGVEVQANKTVYISLLSCTRSGASMASGPYPRSPIANETTAPKARQADSLTVDGNANFRPEKGTLDIELYPLFPSNLSSSFQFYFAHLYGGDGQARLYRDDANKVRFRVQANGDDDSVVGMISWNRGDRVKIRAVWNCQEKLDGTNYMLMYGKVNDGAWSQIGACPNQPTAPSSDQSLYVGRAGDSSGYEANSFISWLRIYDRPMLNPSW